MFPWRLPLYGDMRWMNSQYEDELISYAICELTMYATMRRVKASMCAIIHVPCIDLLQSETLTTDCLMRCHKCSQTPKSKRPSLCAQKHPYNHLNPPTRPFPYVTAARSLLTLIHKRCQRSSSLSTLRSRRVKRVSMSL